MRNKKKDLYFIFYIDLSKLRFIFLSRTAWHTHARTHRTEKEEKKFCEVNNFEQKKNTHRAREKRKEKQCVDFPKKTILFVQR